MLDQKVEEQTTALVPQNAHTAEFFIAKIEGVLATSIMGFIEVGRWLLQAKEELRHGQFFDMIEEDLPFSSRTAERFMAIASHSVLVNPTHVSVLPWPAVF